MPTTSKAIAVRAMLRTVYDQWTQFEQFPLFMQGIRRVERLDDTTLRWTADIAGKDTSWTAQITEQVPDRLIAWKSTSGRPNNGRVQFSSTRDNQTIVSVQLEYEPEGLVENVGDALGLVERRIEADLGRFKEFVERRGRETGAWRGEVRRRRAAGTTST